MVSEKAGLSPEDTRLLDRLAERVVELHMEVPAILALESGRPLSLIAGQAMLFFEPLVLSVFRFSDYRRYAALVERREALEELVRLIEERVERSRAERRAKSTADRARPGSP